MAAVVCTICNKSFMSGEGCIKHMKKEHGLTRNDYAGTDANILARREAAARKKAKYQPKAVIPQAKPVMTRDESVTFLAGSSPSHVFCMYCAGDIHKRMILKHFMQKHPDLRTQDELKKWISVQDGNRLGKKATANMYFEDALLEYDYVNRSSSQDNCTIEHVC